MKKIILLCIIILGNAIPIFAQKEINNFSISGQLIDSASSMVINNGMIYLKKLGETAYLKRVLSNVDGSFNIPVKDSGIYAITIYKEGYEQKKIEPILLSNTNIAIHLAAIRLLKSSNQLKEIVIANKRNTIEINTDKTIFNVENDLTAQTGNAADIIKKMPQIAQNADGSLELMGNASIQYLIDGKTSTLFHGNSIDALQSIPASQIQKIEIMSNPSSKYDASGAGGVINIILKKSKIEGYTFLLNGSIGTRIENGTLNTNYNKNKLSLNLMLSGNQQLNGNMPSGSDRTITNSSGTEHLIQDNQANFERANYKCNGSLNYKLTEQTELQSNFNYNRAQNNTDGLIYQKDLWFANGSNPLLSQDKSIRKSSSTNKQVTKEFNIKIIKKLNSKGDNISILGIYSDTYQENYYNQIQQGSINLPYRSGTQSFNPGHLKETSWSLDYFKNLSKNFYFESGIKYVQQHIFSDMQSATYDSSSQKYLIDNYNTNTNSYDRSVMAAYAQISKTINKNELKLGMRYEYTISKPWFSNSANNYHNEYGNLAPSLLLAHKFDDHNFIKFSYAYRIERPDYKDLNPFYNLSDPHNITTGNPLLKTEIGNNFELSYNKVKENAYSYTIILFCQYNSPDIKPYISYYNSLKIGDSIYQNVTLTTRGNISAETRYGINASAGIEIQKKWSIRPSVQLFNRHLVNLLDTPSILNGIGFRTNLNISYKLNQTWNAEIFGNYNLGMRWQGQQASNYSYTFAIRKQVAKSGMSFGLVAVNLFNPYIHQVSITDTRTIQMTSFKDVPYRSIGLSFSIKLGTLKVSKIKEGDNYLLSPPEN